MMRRLSVIAALVFTTLSTSAATPTKRAANPRPPLSLRQSTIENNASCDISVSPSATLLLPYFEVDITKPVNQAANTIFSIVNTVRVPQIARVTVWTDQGYPAVWFNVFLTGYDVQSISLYDVLARGMVPQTSSAAVPGDRSAPNGSNGSFLSLEGCAASGGEMSQAVRESLQKLLTTGVQDSAECRVGSQHANATGYVTVDVVNSCSTLSPLDTSYYSQILLYDNVLTGDFERINPDQTTGNYAGGSPMVHIKAVPEGGTAASGTTSLPYTFYDRFTPPGARRIDRRQPLPAAFAARFIQGGRAQFFTAYVLWREGAAAGGSACTSANAAMPVAATVRFDEDENPTVNADSVVQSAPSSSAIPTTAAMFPPLTGYSVTGWMLIDLDNRAAARAAGNPFSSSRPSQNWLLVRLSAEGRYAVDYDATAIANGCTNAGPVVQAVAERSEK